MEGPYVYRSLAHAENIRTLILQPAESLKDPLICSLEELSSGHSYKRVKEHDSISRVWRGREVGLENTSYTALSYSWAMEDDNLIPDSLGRNMNDEEYDATHAPGDSTPTKPLVLDGAHVLVGQNLSDALRRLRPSSGEPARLWVDALCINQRDDLEKSRQVAMMASIFHHANLIVAWLGEGEEEVNAAAEIPFRCLLAESKDATYLSGSFLRHNWTWYPDHSAERETCAVCRGMGVTNVALPHKSSFQAVKRAYHRWREAPASCRDGSLPTSLHRAWQGWPNPGTGSRSIPPQLAILTLSRRRYFKRLWVVQEVATRTADRVAFQWGGFRLAGNPLRCPLISGILFPKEVPDTVEKSVRGYKMVRGNVDLSGRLNLSVWVQYSSTMQCFDPRDRVYGLLGCTSTGIRPDYDKNLIEVYADFARYLLAEGRFETLISNSCGCNLGSQDGLPTWMPDLRQRYNDTRSAGGLRLFDTNTSISEDSMVLRCHLAYKGTIGAPCTDPPTPIRKHDVVWRIEKGPHDPCYDTISSGERHIENATDGAVIALFQGVFAVRPIEYRPGDILCGSPPLADFMSLFVDLTSHDPFSLVLRSTQAGQWQIIGSWHDGDLQYTGSIRPEERREYHVI